MGIRELIVAKVTSGRYYLTVVSGIAFLYCVWKRTMPPEAIASIITSIFVSYFSRTDRNGKQEVVK